ncbi:hypothetical protein Tco_1361307 [Tanacetum coccineum]
MFPGRLSPTRLDWRIDTVGRLEPPPQVGAIIEDITECGTSEAFKHGSDKMLPRTWHDSSTSAKESVCDYVTPRSLPQDDYSTPSKDSVCESATPMCMPHGVKRSKTSSFYSDFSIYINEVPVSEEAYVSRTEEHVVEQVIVEEVVDDKENEIVEPDVDVHLFGISKGDTFDNIGVTNLVPNDVLEGDDVDVVNLDGFDSDTSNDNETSNYKRRIQKFASAKEANDRVHLHSIESRRMLKQYKNDNIRVRARYEGKVPVFTMSQGTGPTGQNQGMGVRPSRSDAHHQGDLCPWVLEDFDQVRVNPEIQVKAVQDQLQCDLKLYVSMSKAFRAKAKAERELPVWESAMRRPQTLRGKAFDETRAEVIQDLAFPQASQELFDPIEA